MKCAVVIPIYLWEMCSNFHYMVISFFIISRYLEVYILCNLS